MVFNVDILTIEENEKLDKKINLSKDLNVNDIKKMIIDLNF